MSTPLWAVAGGQALAHTAEPNPGVQRGLSSFEKDLGLPPLQSSLGPGTEGAAPTPSRAAPPPSRQHTDKVEVGSALWPPCLPSPPLCPHYLTRSGAELLTLYQEGSVFKDRAIPTPKMWCANGGGFQELRTMLLGREHPLASVDTVGSCMPAEAPRAGWDLGLPLPPQPA